MCYGYNANYIMSGYSMSMCILYGHNVIYMVLSRVSAEPVCHGRDEGLFTRLRR